MYSLKETTASIFIPKQLLINNFSNTKKRDKFYPHFQAYEGNINIDLLTD